jgi:ribosome biogenesis protein MAK21
MVKTPSAKSPKGRFIAPPTPQWYASILPLGPHGPIPPLTPSSLASFASRASSLHVSDTRTFQESSSSESSFLHKVLQSGTLSDRLSALTLLVQSSPVHNIKALESLKGMAERGKGKGGREECLKALRCVVDWWVGGGAPSRKLKQVHQCQISITWF